MTLSYAIYLEGQSLLGYALADDETNYNKNNYKNYNSENISTLLLTQGVEEKMKNITKHPSGLYIVRYQQNGIRHCEYAHSQKEALRILSRIKKKANNPESENKVGKNLDDWLFYWYENYKQPFIKEKSAKNLMQTLKEISRGIGQIRINTLTTDIVQRYYNRYEKSRKKEFIILYLNACLQKAEDLDIIQKNPCKAVVKDKKLNNIRDPFTFAEQQKILNAIKGNEVEPVILFYLLTGIRKNELNTTNIENDIKGNLITVASEKKRGSKQEYRYIDVTPGLIDLVKSNIKSFRLTTNQIYRYFKQVLNNIGIKGSLHNLRHTYTSNNFILRNPQKMVSEWLGHEKVELTQNIYTHIERGITRNDVIKLYNNLYYIYEP